MLNILQPHAEYHCKGVYFKDIEEPITPAIVQKSDDFEVVNPYPYVVYLGHFDIVPASKIFPDGEITSAEVKVNDKECLTDNIELTQTGELVIAYSIMHVVEKQDTRQDTPLKVTFKMQVRNYADFVEHSFNFKHLSALSREYRQLTSNLVDMAHSDAVIETKRNLDWVVNGYCKFDGKLFKIDQVKEDYSKVQNQALRFSNINKIYTLRLIEVTNDWGQ